MIFINFALSVTIFKHNGAINCINVQQKLFIPFQLRRVTRYASI
jgi:hypothetical protein